MKHNILIDQRAWLESGLSLNRYVVLDLIVNASSWADTLVIDEEVFYWTARQVVVKELPAFDLKADTVYRIFCDLAKEGWIKYEKAGPKDATLALDKAKKLFRTPSEKPSKSTMSDGDPDTMSDGDPDELGWPSESDSDGGPTYPTTSNYPSTRRSNNPQTPTNTAAPDDRFPSESVVEVFTQYAKIYRSQGGQVPVTNATADFNRLVLKPDRLTEFSLGLQNYLNDKKASEQTRLKNFDAFIREGLWIGHEETREGTVVVPGAPDPTPVNAFDLALAKANGATL